MISVFISRWLSVLALRHQQRPWGSKLKGRKSSGQHCTVVRIMQFTRSSALFCSVLSVRFTTVPLQVNLYTDMCRMLNRLLFWSKLLPSLPAIADLSHPQRMPSAMTFTCNNKSFAEPTQKNLPFKKTQKNH
jgi:hypothetical protein